jgi:hypothetical protein
VWLGDAEGHSIPFEIEREGLWVPRSLELEQLITGRDAQHQPSAQFRLKFPEGWQVREREHLHLELDLEGKGPWVCRVEVERRLEGGAFLRLEREAPLHLYDLGSSGSTHDFTIAWDAQDYRITLIPAQGEAPSIRGLRIIASTRPEELQSDEVMEPTLRPSPRDGVKLDGETERWLLELPQAERIVGADVALKPPVAPIRTEFRIPSKNKTDELEGAFLAQDGLVWNLPALNTKATRVALGPVVADRLELSLPQGVRLDHVKLLVRRDVLLFPAEAGRGYYLHSGGRMKQAPGNLASLPDSSRAVYARQPLKLGQAEADPQGLPRLIEATDRTRPWLPWIAGLVVALLGLFAWRLFANKAEA